MQNFTQSIILKRVAFGEADWIVQFFSREHGRLSGIAKSARNSVKRFGGAFEIGTLAEIGIGSLPHSKLVSLKEARIIRPVNGIIKSLEQIEAMSQAIDIALQFLQEQDPVPEKFDLLNKRLEHIANNKPTVRDAILFELHWLKLCGFYPHIENCLGCDAAVKAADGWAFDLTRSGMLCENCSKSASGRIFVTKAVMSGLVSLLSGGLCNEIDVVSLRKLLYQYIGFVLGKKFELKICG